MSERPFPPRPRVAENIQFNAIRATVTLIVEARLDREFWSMYRHPSCLVRAEGGRSAALTLLDKEANNPKVSLLGVLDADWDRLEESLVDREDVVWTDARDLEATLLLLPVIEKLVARHGPAAEQVEARWGERFRERLHRHALGMGRLRWLKRQASALDEVSELVFQKPARKGRGDLERPRYDRCADSDWAPSLEAVIHQVIHFSGAPALAKRDLVSEIAALPDVLPILLCNGHDLIGFFAAAFKTLFGEDIPPVRLADRVITACDRAWLEQTAMWRDVLAWEAAHPGYRVLSDG